MSLDDWPTLTVEESAVLFAQCCQVIARIEDSDILTRGMNTPLPRGMLTCGELWTLVPALFVLLAKHYPDITDPESLAEILMRANTQSAAGAIN